MFGKLDFKPEAKNDSRGQENSSLKRSRGTSSEMYKNQVGSEKKLKQSSSETPYEKVPKKNQKTSEINNRIDHDLIGSHNSGFQSSIIPLRFKIQNDE